MKIKVGQIYGLGNISGCNCRNIQCEYRCIARTGLFLNNQYAIGGGSANPTLSLGFEDSESYVQDNCSIYEVNEDTLIEVFPLPILNLHHHFVLYNIFSDDVTIKFVNNDSPNLVLADYGGSFIIKRKEAAFIDIVTIDPDENEECHGNAFCYDSAFKRLSVIDSDAPPEFITIIAIHNNGMSYIGI